MLEWIPSKLLRSGQKQSSIVDCSPKLTAPIHQSLCSRRSASSPACQVAVPSNLTVDGSSDLWPFSRLPLEPCKKPQNPRSSLSRHHCGHMAGGGKVSILLQELLRKPSGQPGCISQRNLRYKVQIWPCSLEEWSTDEQQGRPCDVVYWLGDQTDISCHENQNLPAGSRMYSSYLRMLRMIPSSSGLVTRGISKAIIVQEVMCITVMTHVHPASGNLQSCACTECEYKKCAGSHRSKGAAVSSVFAQSAW